MKLKQRVSLFIGSLIITIIILRIFLQLSPSTNLDVGVYNVHHLFIGAFFAVIAVVLLLFNIVNRAVIIIAGISSALVLDEIIYLIATDGSDVSYLTAVSFWGSIVMTLIILFLIIVLYYFNKQKVIE